LKAHSALHAQPESVHLISSPAGFVFFEGAWKEEKAMFEVVVPEV